ncbi:putative non-LTR retroelement reverse transcriptase, partial [Trifolium medium]|nr:putative non-LTR retroelement reverse transcriptase [Trifolium medium]
IFIGWKRPPEGWVKLNCDGSRNNRVGIAGCGGLLRVSDGRWIKGYSQKLGAGDALHAEMWGMYLGLDLARQQ